MVVFGLINFETSKNEPYPTDSFTISGLKIR